MKMSDRIIKWFFGVPGTIDEHVKAEIGEVSVKALIITFIFELVFNGSLYLYTSLVTITDFETLLYLVTMIQFIAILLIMGGFTTIVLKKRGVTTQEVVADDKRIVEKRLKHKWLRIAPIIFILYWILGTLFTLEGANFFSKIMDLKTMIGSFIFMIIFCPVMYFYEKGNIKVVQNDV
ncbi:DUF3278 domain-containing protein [Companilactobacillus kimchiensis]|uniref:DUF3278 domain-containing protein n=1 Tax=Companilactobacillus kimchiensis TaxID=993692 RepID=A0A0R2LGR7_9LACO|nr:DUF3278 domain-containing protein [Companilactobacillus kimchiensis]KRN98700.1 hypothetical protein IV57_GL000885 [Companilactobacillus kimchiensis]